MDLFDAAEMIPQLVAGLDNADLLARINCEEALSKMGNRALPLLACAAAGEPIDLPFGNQIELTLRARTAAIKLLGMLRDHQSFRSLTSLLSDEYELIRYRSVAALSDFPDEAVDGVLKNLAHRDRSKRVRKAAKAILRERSVGRFRGKPRFQWMQWIDRLTKMF